jgi:predicted AlkP superfamily phosphohydrolase/phosphomutase
MGGRLLLIAWEAADWRILRPLLDSGRMPALQGILKNGASGTLLSGRPLVPAVQWTSLVTGKRAWQHGVCHQFQFDEAASRPVPIAAGHRKTTALWEILGREGKKCLLVGWPATHGSRSQNTFLVSNRYAEPTAGPGVKPWPPAIAGTYWPAELGPRLDPLRASPESIQADLIARYVPDWRKVDQKRDRRLAHLRVFLAADLSHHAAMMQLLLADDWDFGAIHFPALGAISALFLPFCPPRREWVSLEDFQLYQGVLEAACIVLDRLLHSLAQAAGKDTAIVLASAHGINQHLPPQYLRTRDNEVWKTPYGILAACGAGFCPDALLYGATIHDVAPTILTWFGLPMGDDMEGRVLLESFTVAPEVRRVETWDVPNANAAGQSRTAPEPDDNPTAQRLRLESEWNLVLSYLDAARYEEALPLLAKLFRAFPERLEFGQALFHCQLTVKKTAEAAETLDILLEAIPPGVGSLLNRLELLLAQGNRREARVLVAEVQKLKPGDPEALRRLGMSLWRLREWPALAELARQVLERDENEPLAWLGLAEASLRLDQPAKAAEAAQRAIVLNYFQPQAHLVLARAWVNLGKWTEAREAMQTVMRLQPNNRAADTYARRTGLAHSGT